jgi:hypothetical protein
MEEYTTTDAAAYRVATSSSREVYRFPFVPLDAPGPKSLGRIEWWLELIRSSERVDGSYPMVAVHLWAKQTRDPRYANIEFAIPCHTEALTGLFPRSEAFLAHLWFAGFCQEHGNIILGAYPQDHHTALVLDVTPALQLTASFE